MTRENAYQTAIHVLNEGGIVIFPTDTAFGIGCRIDDQKAVERLFRARKRPRTQAAPVLVSSKDMALLLFDNPSAIVDGFMEQYWPGALTIVAPGKTERICSLIRGGGKNVGIRMPSHEELLRIIAGVGAPILGPSANFHGERTPFTLEELNPKLVQLVDFVFPGECSLRAVSTVVDCSVNPYKILREGALRLDI